MNLKKNTPKYPQKERHAFRIGVTNSSSEIVSVHLSSFSPLLRGVLRVPVLIVGRQKNEF